MGTCPECEAEGIDPQHTRTAGPGLCPRHYMRRYRATQEGKAVSDAANVRYRESEKGRETMRRVLSRRERSEIALALRVQREQDPDRE